VTCSGIGLLAYANEGMHCCRWTSYRSSYDASYAGAWLIKRGGGGRRAGQHTFRLAWACAHYDADAYSFLP